MKKPRIVYGETGGVWNRAVEILSDVLYKYCGEFPSCVSAGEDPAANEGFRCFYIGTRQNNPALAALSGPAATGREAYRITVRDDTVFIEGADAGGVLYGCIDFYNNYAARFELLHTQQYFTNPFEGSLPDCVLESAPTCAERGLWTWGHCIYDYRGYLDNMMRLKMNTLIAWNDFPPTNANEIVAYAHERNIGVIWGFPWLWDTACAEADIAHLDSYVGQIVDYYDENYAGIAGDGVYFQSFTELQTDKIGDVIIAEAVTDFVNKTAAALLEKHPGLRLQFGLHSTSVKNRLEYIAKVDPRVEILWEDGDSFPLNYIPQKIEAFDESMALVEKITVLRGEKENFSADLKGFTNLDWGKFEHWKGPMPIGTASRQSLEKKAGEMAHIWKYVQAYWLRNADKALEMIRLMCEKRQGKLCLVALVEDGAFDAHIYYPVALLAEMLWDCHKDLKDLMADTTVRDYVEFV